jgi:hypothetical protein
MMVAQLAEVYRCQGILLLEFSACCIRSLLPVRQTPLKDTCYLQMPYSYTDNMLWWV